MRVYIAGPMSLTEHQREPFYNYPAFFSAKMDWKTAGYDVITPFETNSIVWQRHHGRGFDPYSDKCEYGDPLLAEMWIENMAALSRARAIALLPGWEHSKGASAELVVALALGKEVYDAITFEQLHLKTCLAFQTVIAA